MSDQASLVDTYNAMHESVVCFTTTRDVVRVSGPEALSYLEGQCSQQIGDLIPGQSVETLILSPQGKIDVYAQVAIDHEGAVLVVVPSGFGDATFERLRRFKLRVKAELELVTLPTTSLRGPHSASVEIGDAVSLQVAWPGVLGVDLVGTQLSELSAVDEGDPRALEVVRIESGIPAMGSEITEKTIPQETGIVERTVSFTKGCYTGQELVARIDARGGRVPRKLRGVVVNDKIADAPEVGEGIVIDNREIGSLTSVGYSPHLDRIVGLAYVRREVEPPCGATILLAGRSVDVSVRELPLTTPTTR